MEDNNKNAAANVAANVEEERMHPIFEECEVMNAGKPAREHMLSMNGMYISGITDEQLKEMHEKLGELLTGEKPAKYFYGTGAIPLKDGSGFFRFSFTAEQRNGDKFPLLTALAQAKEEYKQVNRPFDLDHIQITTVFEISRKDFDGFAAPCCGNVDKKE